MMADMSAWDDAIAQAKWYGCKLTVEYLQDVRARGREDPPVIKQLESGAILIQWDHVTSKTLVSVHNGLLEMTVKPADWPFVFPDWPLDIGGTLHGNAGN